MPIGNQRQSSKLSHCEWNILRLWVIRVYEKLDGMLKEPQSSGKVDWAAQAFTSEPNTQDNWL